MLLPCSILTSVPLEGKKNQGEPPATSIASWSAGVDSELTRAGSYSSRLPSLTHGSSQRSRSALTGSVAVMADRESQYQAGGFVSDEDEMFGPERKRAILSPAKGQKRVTSSVSCSSFTSLDITLTHSAQAVVKVGGIEDDAQLDQEDTKEDTKKSIFRPKNSDLPIGAQDRDRFRKVFIPTLIWYSAFQLDPWKIDDDHFVNGMQTIWNKIYGRAVPITIEIHDNVFQVVRV
jgi:hypothetical protein